MCYYIPSAGSRDDGVMHTLHPLHLLGYTTCYGSTCCYGSIGGSDLLVDSLVLVLVLVLIVLLPAMDIMLLVMYCCIPLLQGYCILHACTTLLVMLLVVLSVSVAGSHVHAVAV